MDDTRIKALLKSLPDAAESGDYRTISGRIEARRAKEIRLERFARVALPVSTAFAVLCALAFLILLPFYSEIRKADYTDMAAYLQPHKIPATQKTPKEDL